jgi:hypothetical protein
MFKPSTLDRVRLVAGLAIVFALVGSGALALGAQTVRAQDAGTTAIVEIHNRLCPEGYEGGNYFEDCHETPAPAGMEFFMSGPEEASAATDASGNATFQVTEGTYTLQGGVPGDFARLFVFCAPLENPGVEYDNYIVLGGGVRGPDDPTGAEITLAAGAAVVCDWYNIPESQQGDASSLTIYKTDCPDGYAGSAYFDDCYGNPSAGVEFAVGTPNTGNVVFGETNQQGYLTFSLDQFDLGPTPESRTITIGEILSSNPHGPVETYAVFCSKDGGHTQVEFDYETGEVAPGGTTLAIRLSFEPGDQIQCDWYNVHPAAAAPTATAAPITPTPDPNARPVAILRGDCVDDLDDPNAIVEWGEVVYELDGMGEPDGDPLGHEDAFQAFGSFSIVGQSLESLLSEDLVIVVGERAATNLDDPVVCGPIGGALDSDDALGIGLAEVDESGFTGIAYFAPGSGDAGQTRISVFIAEDLADDLDALDPAA